VLVALVALVVVALVVVVLVPTAAFAAFHANLVNPTNTFASGTLAFAGASGTSGACLGTATAYTDPGSLSQVAWFKAPVSGYGGNIMGFTNRWSDATPSQRDRQIWIDRSGHLVYGIYPGSIAQAAIVPGQLTRAQIATLYGAGTTAAYADIMGGLTSTSYWPLSTAAVPSGICSSAEATIATHSGATTACAYPAGPGACPVPSPASLLSGVTTLVLPPPVSGSPTTVTVTLSRAAAAPTVTAGLHLLPALRFVEAQSSWSAAVEYPFADPML
jgi:hypothetical protein